jgi:peptidoglycan/LPS O-acetylase OafA/YrhL
MRYNPALDGLRGVSIIAVVLFHCGLAGFQGGFVGLDVFSGYLITSLLALEHRGGGIAVSRFYARRALRLYPTLLLLLAGYLVLAPFLWPTHDAWRSAALAASYVMDYAMAFGDASLPVAHTWSLGVEEKFYLLWPFVLPLLLRSRRPGAWLLGAFFAFTAWRYFAAANWRWQQAYFSFDTRMSGIVLGAIAALVRLQVSRSTVAIAVLALAVDISVPSLPTADQVRAVTLSITLAELCAFVLVCDAAQHAKSAVLAWPPLVLVGRLSYGIYLWHFPVLILVNGQPLWARLAVTASVSLAMAALCLYLIDIPIRRWRAAGVAPRVVAASA